MKKFAIILTIVGYSFVSFSQENKGDIYGDFNLSLQSYQEDLLINAKAADEMDPADVDDFAKTKHKGLPYKVKQETKVR